MDPNLYLTKVFSESEPPVLFLDFDGTISKVDVIDAVLKEFADERWLEIEQQWLDGKIGSRECLSRQVALVKADARALDEFYDTIEIDVGLRSVLQFCIDSGIDCHIVSDGFENYITRMLQRELGPHFAPNLRVWANKLKPADEGRWGADFPYFTDLCEHGCATCKPAVMRLNNPAQSQTIFVGDGMSDRFAAHEADVVFAKSSLAKYCSEAGIPMTEYCDLRPVAASLDQAYEAFAIAVSNGRSLHKNLAFAAFPKMTQENI